MTRTQFYEYKRRFVLQGVEGPKDLPPIHKSHPQTKARHPRTIGFVERFHRTVKEEFFAVALRETFYESVEALQVMINQNAPVNLTLTPTHATIKSPKGAKDSKPGLTVQVRCANQIVQQTIKGNIVMPPQKVRQIKVDAVVPTTPPNADLSCPGVVTIFKFPKGK